MKKTTKQEAWEDIFDLNVNYDEAEAPCNWDKDDIKSFICTLLENQQGELYAWFNEALLKQKKEWMDVSSWKNLGEKYGYFKFFENKIKKEIIEECLEVLNHSIGKDDAYKEILKLLKN